MAPKRIQDFRLKTKPAKGHKNENHTEVWILMPMHMLISSIFWIPHSCCPLIFVHSPTEDPQHMANRIHQWRPRGRSWKAVDRAHLLGYSHRPLYIHCVDEYLTVSMVSQFDNLSLSIPIENLAKKCMITWEPSPHLHEWRTWKWRMFTRYSHVSSPTDSNSKASAYWGGLFDFKRLQLHYCGLICTDRPDL